MLRKTKPEREGEMAQMPRYERKVMRGKEMLEPNPNERSSEGRQGK